MRADQVDRGHSFYWRKLCATRLVLTRESGTQRLGWDDVCHRIGKRFAGGIIYSGISKCSRISCSGTETYWSGWRSSHMRRQSFDTGHQRQWSCTVNCQIPQAGYVSSFTALADLNRPVRRRASLTRWRAKVLDIGGGDASGNFNIRRQLGYFFNANVVPTAYRRSCSHRNGPNRSSVAEKLCMQHRPLLFFRTFSRNSQKHTRYEMVFNICYPYVPKIICMSPDAISIFKASGIYNAIGAAYLCFL